MGRRDRILTEALGCAGWQVDGWRWESADGSRMRVAPGFLPIDGSRVVLAVSRRWLARCHGCGKPCRRLKQRSGKPRRWRDLMLMGHPVELEYTPVRVRCDYCGSTGMEFVPWAEGWQRQTRRLQHHLAVQAASMPVLHVAALYGLSWSTVDRAERDAIARWSRTRQRPALRHVGVDEKWLGRRHHRAHKFVTIVSDLETGEPIWIGEGRGTDTLATWLSTLSAEEKRAIRLFAMDMHRPFFNAVRDDRSLDHAAIVHDPFHVMKRAGEAVTEVRRDAFFRAGPELRRVGAGTRWLVLRAWEKCTIGDALMLKILFAHNATLARVYQIKEELREVLRAPDRASMTQGLRRILRRTARRDIMPLRKLHQSLRDHFEEIVALGEHHPATGRIEALNNNWETLVRRGRGYRNLHTLLQKLAFMTANPIRTRSGLRRFLALAGVGHAANAA